MQRSILPHLSIAREYVILAFRRYLTVHLLKGQGKDGPLTIAFAVHGADTDLKLYLSSILFVEEPVEEEIASVPLRRLGEFTNASSCDLAFIGASKYLIRRLPARNALVLPRIVGQTLDVQGEWEDVLQRLHKKLRRYHLRLMRKYGYEYETSDQDRDFDLFFYEMYLPSMRARHGEQAHIVSYAKAYHHFKLGTLFLVKREGTFASGGLCTSSRDRGVVQFRFTGVKNGDQQLMKEGALNAAYHACIHWANKHGYKAYDFMGTVPYLGKGILQHKKRWGATASIQSHKRIWLKIHRDTPAVRQFLSDNPFIFINEQGDLQGLFFEDEPDNISSETKAKWNSLCNMPGLEGYVVRSVKDFVD
jgi:hypothetical protein